MRMARECIEEWGMKGFKLMPSAVFIRRSDLLAALRILLDRKLPIMFHAGGSRSDGSGRSRCTSRPQPRSFTT